LSAVILLGQVCQANRRCCVRSHRRLYGLISQALRCECALAKEASREGRETPDANAFSEVGFGVAVLLVSAKHHMLLGRDKCTIEGFFVGPLKVSHALFMRILTVRRVDPAVRFEMIRRVSASPDMPAFSRHQMCQFIFRAAKRGLLPMCPMGEACPVCGDGMRCDSYWSHVLDTVSAIMSHERRASV